MTLINTYNANANYDALVARLLEVEADSQEAKQIRAEMEQMERINDTLERRGIYAMEARLNAPDGLKADERPHQRAQP